MNCPECNGATHVYDKRGDNRRRECKACGHRFKTVEVMVGARVPTRHATIAEPAPKPKPKPTPKKPVLTGAQRAKIRAAIEDRAMMRSPYDDMDFLPDF